MKYEKTLAFVFLALVLGLGHNFLASDMLFFRLLIGFGLGYALSRGYMGFAGSVNRAYQTGSTKLMRTLMMMFFVTTLLSTAVLFMNPDVSKMDLWVNPINLGLLAGGILFGFGMTFSSCCASGVLTDLVTSLPRALITLVFFCAGVFLGFPIQNTASWVQQSWFTTESIFAQAPKPMGVYLPDWFKWDGLNGYLGALILTGLICLAVVALSFLYEKKRKDNQTYVGHFSEKQQELAQKPVESQEYRVWSKETYDRLFARPWSMPVAAFVIAILFTLLMGVTKAGWGASTPYGFWFARALHLFGVPAQALADFAHIGVDPITMPFFNHPINVQNVGIVAGTLFYLLSAGLFGSTFKASLSITGKQAFFFALGGFLMGFGTRLSNGCNVGALYTPIANFSLSGWVFFVVLVIGGILGNIVAKKVKV